MNISYFQTSDGRCRLAAGKSVFLTCKLSKYDTEVTENEKKKDLNFVYIKE